MVPAVAFLLFLLAGSSADGQRNPDLDTRSLPKPATPESGPQRVLNRTVVGPFQGAVPVSVRLLAIQPAVCGWGEAITYDVELRNDGPSRLLLPWTLIEPQTPSSTFRPTEFSTIQVSLHLTDDRDAMLGNTESLYGSAEEPLTVCRVQPGESVVLRLPATCTINYTTVERAIGVNGTDLRVFARVSLRRRKSELPAFVQSNERTVTVSRLD